MTKWRIILTNQHAMCSIYADGPTRHIAFNKAFYKAGKTFRHYALAKHYQSAQNADIMWLAAFNNAMGSMGKGVQSFSHWNPLGFGVEIRRIS